MRKDKQQFFEKKDSGFSLITVMVSVSFIAIMGLLVLYLSLNNFQMKHTDIKGKDSFYTAEQALEELRNRMIEAQQLAEEIYISRDEAS